MVIYADRAQAAQGLVCLPSDNVLHPVEAARRQRETFRVGRRPAPRQGHIHRAPLFASEALVLARTLVRGRAGIWYHVHLPRAGAQKCRRCKGRGLFRATLRVLGFPNHC